MSHPCNGCTVDTGADTYEACHKHEACPRPRMVRLWLMRRHQVRILRRIGRQYRNAHRRILDALR